MAFDIKTNHISFLQRVTYLVYHLYSENKLGDGGHI